MLAAAAVLSMAWIYSQKRKFKKPIGAVVMLMTLLVLLAINVNFPIKNSDVIITSSTTYLMSGPSSGANVIAIVEEGHKLRMLNKRDVWLEVQWFDQPVYVKQNRVTPITL
jgi:uncharacterized protein YgiM (DUF1202 family)